MDNLSEMLKGVLEGIVLEIISRGEIYGYEIVKYLTQMGFEGIAEGTVYALLMRLERNRLVNIVKSHLKWVHQGNFIRLMNKDEKN